VNGDVAVSRNTSTGSKRLKERKHSLLRNLPQQSLNDSALECPLFFIAWTVMDGSKGVDEIDILTPIDLRIGAEIVTNLSLI